MTRQKANSLKNRQAKNVYFGVARILGILLTNAYDSFQCRSNNRLQSIFSLSIQHTFINFSFKFRSTKHAAFISPRDIHFQCFLFPDFTNQAWLQSWNETRSRGSDEPRPHLRCHRDECDWQLFSGSFR